MVISRFSFDSKHHVLDALKCDSAGNYYQFISTEMPATFANFLSIG